MMRYRLDEEGFSTDYPFPHLIIEVCSLDQLWDNTHPLVEFPAIREYNSLLAKRPKLEEWYRRNTKVNCAPRLISTPPTLIGLIPDTIVYAFATKAQAFLFKMVFDG